MVLIQGKKGSNIMRDSMNELEQLIEDMAQEYASEHQYYFFPYDREDIKKAFINGFKAGLKFKEGRDEI